MYWYKKSHTNPSPTERGFLFLGIIALACLSACKPEVKQDTGKPVYFDIAGYFKADTARLAKLNPTVDKTVAHNKDSESKTLHIADWGGELELFINSDINKPAWRQSYNVTKGDSVTIYQAKTPDLKTQKVVLKQSSDKLQWIHIYNHTKNALYESYEDLSYYPDSLYQIKKWQHVRLLGTNIYVIKGEIKK